MLKLFRILYSYLLLKKSILYKKSGISIKKKLLRNE